MSPPADWVLNQKEAQQAGIHVAIRFADRKGKMRKYIGPDYNDRGSRAFGRALERIKTEALNWFVGESLYAAGMALAALSTYLGDYAAEVVKSFIGDTDAEGKPFLVYTGSMIESIAPKDNGQIKQLQRSVSYSVAIGIMDGARRYERSGLDVPRPRDTMEYVANYAYPKVMAMTPSGAVTEEISAVLGYITSQWARAGAVDSAAWAQMGMSELAKRIHAYRQEVRNKVLDAAEHRIGFEIDRAMGKR